jgi:hypothetical protein
MQTLYLIVITILGGVLATFGVAGWRAYKEKKLPEMPELFRWFASGSVAGGLGAYAWIFGAGGDPGALVSQVTDSLEVKEVLEGLTSAVASVGEKAAEASTDLKVGMPTF